MFSSNSHPARSYDEALSRAKELQSQDDTAINPLCRTQFLTHGTKTDNAIVLLHGFTNCPQQFASLGKTFFDHDFNVLIPRIPRHGFADRLTKEPARTSAEEMVAFTAEVVDIAQGLGDRVTVMGLSGGGVMAAWAAQYRSDVDKAIIIAPNFAYVLVPKKLTRAMIGVALTVPNIFIWWDDKLKMNTQPDYAYPRFSTRAIAEVTRLGYAIRSAAKKEKPLAKSIVMVLNETDEAVDNDVPMQLAKRWRANGGDVRDTVFKAEMGLRHDLIDPNQPYQRTDVVYPILLELVKG